MASPTQRWVFLLSVCLLLQQFGLVFTAHVKKKHSSHQDHRSDRKDLEEALGEKRFLAGAKFLGSKILKGITFGAYAVTFGSTVIQAVAGCKVTNPSIETDFQEFQQLQKEYDSTKKQIMEVSRLAEERQICSNDSFYNYRDTRDRVRALADEQTLVLKSMGPEVLIIINNVSFALERIFEEANKTNQEVDVLEVDTNFAEGLELGLRLTFASTAIAIPGMKKLWTSYLKDSTVGKRITGFIDKFKTKVTTPVASGAKNTLSKILSKGILGKINTKITEKLNRIITKVAPRFTKAKRLFDTAKSGLKGVLKLGTAALAIWTAVETFDNCKKKAKEAKQSVKDLTKHLGTLRQHLAEVNEANEEVQQAWKEVYSTTMADDLLNTLQDMRSMMLEDYFSSPSNKDEKDDVAQRIQEYIQVKDLNPDEEKTKEILNKRQRDVNEVLGAITVTLSCFRRKGNTFGAVKLECARGDSPFPFIYSDIANKVPVDPAQKCLQRTGEEYITEARMKEAWTKWVEGNGTDISEVCLMNNKILVNQVKDKLREKVTDPSVIANIILNKDKVRKGGVEEVQAMIDKIKEEFPNLENEFSDDDKQLICNYKKNFPNPEEVIQYIGFGKPELAKALTVEIVMNLKCD